MAQFREVSLPCEIYKLDASGNGWDRISPGFSEQSIDFCLENNIAGLVSLQLSPAKAGDTSSQIVLPLPMLATIGCEYARSVTGGECSNVLNLLVTEYGTQMSYSLKFQSKPDCASARDAIFSYVTSSTLQDSRPQPTTMGGSLPSFNDGQSSTATPASLQVTAKPSRAPPRPGTVTQPTKVVQDWPSHPEFTPPPDTPASHAALTPTPPHHSPSFSPARRPLQSSTHTAQGSVDFEYSHTQTHDPPARTGRMAFDSSAYRRPDPAAGATEKLRQELYDYKVRARQFKAKKLELTRRALSLFADPAGHGALEHAFNSYKRDFERYREAKAEYDARLDETIAVERSILTRGPVGSDERAWHDDWRAYVSWAEQLNAARRAGERGQSAAYVQDKGVRAQAEMVQAMGLEGAMAVMRLVAREVRSR
ncbi:hypothetical protein J8273_0334 [Carpediemonas membranifera]|uniref:Uncharacterized protein n=1 Tax=Carpediemonas membranifera TaxID=201153 RepID=A0A8J6AZD5_9EUKA|nr:hypothetical protein J8273_0334 [Carpediemonas membranifera]|eukprot:KAG9395115.1 hypothetical protein J8273_0334 [Carpediemonas membranifera]